VSDIFISYSKADREKVMMLAAYLESEGWSVWWDTSLGVGDTYRDEIMTQLVAARATIVLWTQNSIRSDFVRAEAGRAKADGKLIPVKESDVAYRDIPLPFGEQHCVDLSNRDLIRAAVVGQLEPLSLARCGWRARRCGTKCFRGSASLGEQSRSSPARGTLWTLRIGLVGS
jgi:TIR domain